MAEIFGAGNSDGDENGRKQPGDGDGSQLPAL